MDDGTQPPCPIAATPEAKDGTTEVPAGLRVTRWAVTAVTAIIAALTFGFSFGNVWTFCLAVGVHPWIAPLVGPAVDLSVVGLLVAIGFLSRAGWSDEQLCKPRRLLYWCGAVTMALNVAPSLVAQAWARAAVEAVAPWLLIAWSDVGPWLLRQFALVQRRAAAVAAAPAASGVDPVDVAAEPVAAATVAAARVASATVRVRRPRRSRQEWRRLAEQVLSAEPDLPRTELAQRLECSTRWLRDCMNTA